MGGVFRGEVCEVGRLLCGVWGSGDNAFAPFDFLLLHCDGAVEAVEFVIEAAGIADGVAALVAAPEGCDCGAAILTCGYNAGCILS